MVDNEISEFSFGRILKILMKPFQQVCDLKYIIPSSITPTQTLIFIGLQYNEPNPNVDSMVQYI
jgi:hypothetical protein